MARGVLARTPFSSRAPADAARSIVIMNAAKDDATTLDIDGREVRVSHPGKLVFPEPGLTKLDLLNYYLAVAGGALARSESHRGNAISSGLLRVRRRGCFRSMRTVVFDVWFRPQDVRDLFLRTRRDGLVDLEFGDRRLIRSGDVVLRGMLEVERHGESFDR